MDGYQHFIRLNEAGDIILGFSTAFGTPQDGDICILEDGPRHFHQAWPEPLTNERGQFVFKWDNGQRVERSQAELDAEWAALPPPPPTQEEQIASLKSRVSSTEQSASDNSLTTQQLLETLIDTGVIV